MKKTRELHLLETLKGPWQKISIDIIGLLPRSNGKDTIVVIVDQFTKIIWLKATIMSVSSEEIAKIYWDKIWKIYGVPWKILSDRRPQFTSWFMENLAKILMTGRTLFIAYHSQTDSQTEWINQEVEAFLQHYVNYQQDNWIEWLETAEFQYNNKRYTATRRIPFKLNFERHSWKGNLTVQTELLKLENFFSRLQRSWKEATKSIEIAKEAMKWQFDKKRRNLQELKAGDNIWLEAKNIYSNRPSKKLN